MIDTSSDLYHWLTIAQAPQLGSSRIQKLFLQFENTTAICRASAQQLKTIGLNDEQIQVIHNPNHQWNHDVLLWLQKNKKHHVLTWHDPQYPPLLKEIAQPPMLLYVNGDLAILHQPQIAIVGSRNPSHIGLELATEFSYALAEKKLCITSGLAMGIDTAAHRGALQALGNTIAVLGSGLQKIYPVANAALAEKIADQGCVVSEFPLNSVPARNHFPQRNRIISGFSLGTVVVEAALKSGSLITARLALEQNREVFAVPGSPRSPLSLGCLLLIQQGAKCVTSIDDILQEIHFNAVNTPKSIQNRQSDHSSTLDYTEQQVLACIQDAPTTIDQICSHSKLSAQTVTATLLTLELAGVVTVYHGAYVKA